MVERKKALELKKHVAAIHSSNKLSLLQRKIANALLFNAYDDLLIKEEYSIHIASLCKLIGYASNDSKTIKKSLVNLLATVIEWNLVDGDKLDTEGVWNASSIIADASIDGPLCTYSYSNKMKKLLHRPELYGRLNMQVQAKFQSTYGLALYENCIRFQRIQQTPWFDILTFRKLMGVEDNKYKVFRDFKSRVLDKALQEVNKYSSITVNAHYRKQGRKVVAIQFSIQPEQNSDDCIEQDDLSNLLKNNFGLSKKQVEMVLGSHEEVYIREKMAIVEMSRSFKQGKIKNLAKYLMSALQDDYQIVKSSERSKEPPVQRKKMVYAVEVIDAHRRHLNKSLLKQFAAQPKTVQQTFLVEFEKHLGKSIYRDIFLRDGLKNILIQDQICLFINHKKPSFINHSGPSLEVFAAELCST